MSHIDITICGKGKIDGNRSAFYNEKETNRFGKYLLGDWRPGQMLFICECTDVTIRDVELTNPPYWTCFLHGCEYVVVDGIKSHNTRRGHQTDGLDIDCCRYVTVSNFLIDSADDAITLRCSDKRLKNKKPCEYVTISSCALRSFSNAIRIGVGSGTVRNCTFNNLAIRQSRTGVCMVGRYCGPYPYAHIENIMFSNIIMETEIPFNIVGSMEVEKFEETDGSVIGINYLFFKTMNMFMKNNKLVSHYMQDDICLDALLYISKNFADNINLKDVASALGVSYVYLSRIFAKEINFRFVDCINSFRIQKALSLLANPDKSIGEICFECGFGSIRQFNRVFLDTMSCTPKEYKKAMNNI